jgi:hypothetical protein
LLFLNYQFRINAPEIALGIVQSPMNQFFFAVIQFLLAFGSAFVEIIAINFIAEIVKHEKRYDNYSNEPDD